MVKTIMVLALLSISMCCFGQPTTWNLNAEMNTTVNDNGIWSYGWADPNSLVYRGLLETAGGGGNPYIWTHDLGTVPGPQVLFGPANGIPANTHGMNGGPTGEGALVRWTAPANITHTTVIIDASFQPVSTGIVDIKIVKNDNNTINPQSIVLIHETNVDSSGATLSSTCDINAGDTIDFVVGPGSDGAESDWTSTSLVIKETCFSYLDADMNKDCQVDLSDYSLLAFSWLDTITPEVLLMFAKSWLDTSFRLPGSPALVRADNTTYSFAGVFNSYLQAIQDNWLIGMQERNPAIIEMFANRDAEPTSALLPWSGEFAGKYLTGAVQVLRLTNNSGLQSYLQTFVNNLIAEQAEDGYLGPWPDGYHLTATAPNVRFGFSWDCWNHYHVMYGLILWYEQTGDTNALNAAKKIADLFYSMFYGNPGSLAAVGSEEMNFAPAHAFSYLFRMTGDRKYYRLAQFIIDNEYPLAGDYITRALAGNEFYECPQHRWESLHPLMAVADMFWNTEHQVFHQAYDHMWWSIAKLDRHNTGGFSTGEGAVGNPYAQGPIETCAVVAWAALCVEELRMTGNSVVADELEMTTRNAIMGYEWAEGNVCAYNTPMEGKRNPSTEDIAFQIYPGSEELNCCSANSARGFGLVSEWALMKDKNNGVLLNWYGPSTFTTDVNGTSVTIEQQTTYPKTGQITLHVTPAQSITFDLKLRIPYWSQTSSVSVNGQPVSGVTPGEYCTLSRQWTSGDVVTINLDMSLHFWSGENEYAGKTSIYRGPILLALPYKYANEVTYSSGWGVYGTMRASCITDATVTVKFSGTSINWRCKKYNDAGIAEVTIDGNVVASVDLYDPVRETPYVWTYNGLADSEHTMTIRVTGTRNAASSGNWINVINLRPITFSPEWNFYQVIYSSNVTGAVASTTFTGSNVTWRCMKFNDGGIAEVSIDGSVVASVDLYCPNRDVPFMWSYTGLTDTEHTIKIRVTGTRNAASNGNWINVLNIGSYVFNADNISCQLATTNPDVEPDVSVNITNMDGNIVNLVNFSSTGKDKKTFYNTWLEVHNAPIIPFSTSNPLRSGR